MQKLNSSGCRRPSAARESTITLPHNLVSRRHCEIIENNGHLFVRDLNSLNGTYLNNEKISGTQVLLPNQLLTLGNVTFRAVYETEADSAMPKMSPDSRWQDDDSVTGEGQRGESVAVDSSSYACYQPSSNGSPDNAIPIDEPDTDHALETVRRVEDQADDETSGELVIDHEPLARDRSIAVSAIDQLPREKPSESFNAGIELDLPRRPVAQVQLDEIRIDTGSNQDEDQAASSSKLDSFLRKMPK